MRMVIAIVMMGVWALALPLSSVSAAPARHSPATVAVGFRLRVAGNDPGATYWVSYGPVGGKFGIIQLHRAGHGLYVAQPQVPAAGKATFYYLVGHGVQKTRLGLVPGNPVVTIRSVGPVALSQSRVALPTVQWQAPIG